MRQLQADDWFIELIYLYLPSVQLSIERVAERVKHGGHPIALKSIIRRYPKSLYNLINVYMPICDSIICLDNSTPEKNIIFMKNAQGIQIKNKPIHEKILKTNI